MCGRPSARCFFFLFCSALGTSPTRRLGNLFGVSGHFIGLLISRGPELTAAVQAPLQLQLNCCHTGSSTDAACSHMGCSQRLRYTKWAGGSRSQTHRRAAMCGFTQDDGYVRSVAADAQRFTGSLLDLLLDVRATFFKNTILLINPRYRYRYRGLEQVPIAGA